MAEIQGLRSAGVSVKSFLLHGINWGIASVATVGHFFLGLNYFAPRINSPVIVTEDEITSFGLWRTRKTFKWSEITKITQGILLEPDVVTVVSRTKRSVAYTLHSHSGRQMSLSSKLERSDELVQLLNRKASDFKIPLFSDVEKRSGSWFARLRTDERPMARLSTEPKEVDCD